jgi:hypothetical protein
MRLASALNNLGYCRLRRGQHDLATPLFEEGLVVSREIGHRTGQSVMLGNLGLAALLEGRPADALERFREALLIDRELGYTEGQIYGLVGVAAALPVGVEAATLLGAAHAGAEVLTVELEPLEAEIHARVTAALKDELGAEQFAQAHAAGEALGLDEAVESALRAGVSTP